MTILSQISNVPSGAKLTQDDDFVRTWSKGTESHTVKVSQGSDANGKYAIIENIDWDGDKKPDYMEVRLTDYGCMHPGPLEACSGTIKINYWSTKEKKWIDHYERFDQVFPTNRETPSRGIIEAVHELYVSGDIPEKKRKLHFYDGKKEEIKLSIGLRYENSSLFLYGKEINIDSEKRQTKASVE